MTRDLSEAGDAMHDVVRMLVEICRRESSAEIMKIAGRVAMLEHELKLLRQSKSKTGPVSITEAARQLGICRTTLRRIRLDHPEVEQYIVAIPGSSQSRVDVEGLRAWLQGRTTHA